jgi:hypothetical protein
LATEIEQDGSSVSARSCRAPALISRTTLPSRDIPSRVANCLLASFINSPGMRWHNSRAQHLQTCFYSCHMVLRISANPRRFPIRLYQPPVESDIQSKPSADRAVRSRSTIRRVLDRNEDRIRERRRRVLAAAVAYNNYDARRGSATVEPAPVPPATTDSTGTRSGSEHSRRALRDAHRRIGIPDDQAATMFERWAHMRESNLSPLFGDHSEPSPMPPMAVEPDFLPRRNQLRPEPTYALSSIRSTQAPDHPVSTLSATKRYLH